MKRNMLKWIAGILLGAFLLQGCAAQRNTNDCDCPNNIYNAKKRR